MRFAILVSRYRNEMSYLDDIQYSVGRFKSRPKARQYAREHNITRYIIIPIERKKK